MILLSIDPGTVATGCCLLKNGMPIACWTLRRVTSETVCQEMLRARPSEMTMTLPDEVVIEVPDSWTRGGKNVKEILSVSGIAHTLYGWFIGMHVPSDRVHLIPVSKWKGRKRKTQTAAELQLEEKAMGREFSAKKTHERDAVALGLWWWQRRTIERYAQDVVSVKDERLRPPPRHERPIRVRITHTGDEAPRIRTDDRSENLPQATRLESV